MSLNAVAQLVLRKVMLLAPCLPPDRTAQAGPPVPCQSLTLGGPVLLSPRHRNLGPRSLPFKVQLSLGYRMLSLGYIFTAVLVE